MEKGPSKGPGGGLGSGMIRGNNRNSIGLPNLVPKCSKDCFLTSGSLGGKCSENPDLSIKVTTSRETTPKTNVRRLGEGQSTRHMTSKHTFVTSNCKYARIVHVCYMYCLVLLDSECMFKH